MTMLPITYGYARVSKADDDSRNLDTQLRLLADHGIRRDLVFTDVASGHSMNRPGWQDLIARVQPELQGRGPHPRRPHPPGADRHAGLQRRRQVPPAHYPVSGKLSTQLGFRAWERPHTI